MTALHAAFRSILIANRGKIALRIMRTARRLSMPTVAAYSDAGRDAPHCRAVDLALPIGASQPQASYLSVAALLEAARKSGAWAVHPDYGFFTGDDAFAGACTDAGFVFIGPPAGAIRVMGNKAGAKRLTEAAGVPCVPGYQGEDQSAIRMTDEAARIGYPVTIKTAAGGGGRGIRRVDRPEAFAAVLRSVRSEAENAFDSGELILEKAIVEPRHIEIQVFADARGNVVHLEERDCSVQRRHQKVIKGSPSPAVSPELRTRMGVASVAAVRTIGYAGASTLEFLLAPDDALYFMEMDTRLQVEHAVAEAIVGVDLVEWQLRAALGELLPLTQDAVDARRVQGGHAIEVRLCAEDPQQNFLPQSDTVARWHAPGDIRTGHALADGLVVSPYYDSMLAKIVAHGIGRADAYRHLAHALDDCLLLGLSTNRAFLHDCVAHPAFPSGDVSTTFIDRHFPAAMHQATVPDATVCQATAVLFTHLCQDTARRYPTELHGWASSRTHPTLCHFTLDGEAIDMRVRVLGAQQWELTWDGGATQVAVVSAGDGRVTLALGGAFHVVDYTVTASVCHFVLNGIEYTAIDTTYAKAERSGAQTDSGCISAPMNGHVVAVHVAEGEAARAGQVPLVVEAMKMEHSIAAPLAGEMRGLFTQVGAQVAPGGLLVGIAAA